MIGSIVAACGGIAFFAIGVGAIVAPGLSSVQYGLPATDRAALALIRAVGARDVVLGIVILLLLATRDRRGLETVLGASVLAAFGDATAVLTGRDQVEPRHVVIHVGGAGALIIAWLLLRGGR